MTIAWSDVAAIAPELGGTVLTPAAQDAILAFVNEAFAIAPSDLGAGQYRLAQLNLAAHIATMERRKNVAGPLTAESMGGVSRSYGPVTNPSLFSQTGYGQLVAMLLRTSLARLPRVIGGPATSTLLPYFGWVGGGRGW